MRYLVLIGLLCIPACASAPAVWTPATRTSAATCSDPGAPASTPWQLVTGRGFTFCVPASWQSSDGRSWRSGGSVVGWCTLRDLAACPNVTAVTFEFTGTVTHDQSLPPATALAQGADACAADQLAETIGGRLATLSHEHCGGHHVTQATWAAPALHFVGETDDASTARLELQVYRSVRFTAD
jgi:hypothetical protein